MPPIHDYVIANQTGANTRSDLNNAFSAIVSNNSSATEPTTTYAYMWWADTGNDLLKQRNAADSAWISILTLSTGAVSNAAIADDAVTLAKMAAGTDGELITYDTSGDPTTVPTGSSGEVLTSNGAGTTPTFQTAAGGGKVLQVVMGTDTGYTTTTSSTYSDTGLSTSITPATGSKVLALISHGGCDKRNANGGMGLKLLRGSTEILLFSGQFGYTESTLIQSGSLSYSYLDASPGGDGSTVITYKTQFKSTNSITAGIHAGGETSTITLIEIGA